MNDIELTRLCAEAMEFKVVYHDDIALPLAIESPRGAGLYNPLHDDAQCMALVKKMELMIDTMAHRPSGWMVCHAGDDSEETTVINTDLNRSVCECVALMQQAKGEA